MSQQEKKSDLSSQNEWQAPVFPRRTFLKGAVLSILAGKALLTEQLIASPTSPSPEIENSVLSFDLDNNVVFPSHSTIFERRHQNETAQTAEVTQPLDEPLASVISCTEGSEQDELEHQITFKDYMLDYAGQQFVARARVLQSENYPTTLHFYFNNAKQPDRKKNREVMAITYNIDTPQSDELTQVTVFFLNSYVEGDPDVDQLALRTDFYEQRITSEGETKHSIKEQWSVQQFAQAFHPRAIESISKACGVASFNQLRSLEGVKKIHNATVVVGMPYNIEAVAIAHDPHDDFMTDVGSIYEPSARTPTESAMKRMAAELAHELGHGTSRIFIDGKPGPILYYSSSRDLQSENFAEMCQAAYLEYVGDVSASESLYKNSVQQAFKCDKETGMFSFAPYSPLLFSALLIPHNQTILSSTGKKSTVDESKKMSVHELNQLAHDYIALGNSMMTDLGSNWYSEWRNNFYDQVNKQMMLAHIDIYAPLVYASYQVKGKVPLRDKNGFMDEVIRTVENEAFSERVRMLANAFLQSDAVTLPYFSDIAEEFTRSAVVTEDQFYPHKLLPTPALGESVEIVRSVDPVYLVENSKDEVEWMYRRFYPYYSINKIPQPPLGEEYVIEKLLEDDELLIVIRQPTFAKNSINLVEEFPVTELVKGEPLILDPNKITSVNILDMRPNQIDDDATQTKRPLFKIISRKKIVIPIDPPDDNPDLFLPQVENQQ